MNIEIIMSFAKEAQAIAKSITDQALKADPLQALNTHTIVSNFLERADQSGIINLERLQENSSWIGKDIAQGAGSHPYKTRTVIRSQDGKVHLTDPALHFKLAVGHVRQHAMRIYNREHKPRVVQAPTA